MANPAVPALQTIHDQVMGLGFDACAVDLFTVDSQFSHNRGVTVLVTGALTFMVGCPCCPGQGREMTRIQPAWLTRCSTPHPGHSSANIMPASGEFPTQIRYQLAVVKQRLVQRPGMRHMMLQLQVQGLDLSPRPARACADLCSPGG